MIECTVGVMAYNEEHNIVAVLEALLNQCQGTCHICKIIVVASGCTDRTVELARRVAQEHALVSVEVQAERAGKATAINRLIQLAQGDVIVLVGADTLPHPTALEHLVQPFEDSHVGMTGARIVPLNDPRKFLGFTVQMLWHVHHRMALRWAKLGELVAFRNVISELPINSATDEVALEALISAQGLRLVYAPEALVYNLGPQTLSDFLTQRRRIYAGHLHVAAQFGYVAASLPVRHLLVLAQESIGRYPSLLPWMIGAVLLEIWARALGGLDFMFGRTLEIWRPVRSTKQVLTSSGPLMLLTLQCRAGTIRPARLLQCARTVPALQGTLVWWDHRNSQLLLKLPASQKSECLEPWIDQIARHISDRRQSPQDIVLSYCIVTFSRTSAVLQLAPNDLRLPAPDPAADSKLPSHSECQPILTVVAARVMGSPQARQSVD
jgi:biofilm PGA synthesis N-glycosyltransferase PgaC